MGHIRRLAFWWQGKKRGARPVRGGGGEGLRPLGVEVDADEAVRAKAPEGGHRGGVRVENIVRHDPGLRVRVADRAAASVRASTCDADRPHSLPSGSPGHSWVFGSCKLGLLCLYESDAIVLGQDARLCPQPVRNVPSVLEGEQ